MLPVDVTDLRSKPLFSISAGIFDIIYPYTNSDSEPQLGEEPLGKAVIMPHPRRALPPLYLTPSAASRDTRDEGPDAADEAEETSTYLGLSGGHLYAMGQREYPLIAFARQFTSHSNRNASRAQAQPEESTRALCCAPRIKKNAKIIPALLINH